jgi:hypothetical protein
MVRQARPSKAGLGKEMNKKPKRYNGLKRRSVLRARGKILREAQKKGFITNARAKKVGKFSQVWFHLKCMEEAGHLKHVDYNTWEPVRRSGPSPYELGSKR